MSFKWLLPRSLWPILFWIEVTWRRRRKSASGDETRSFVISECSEYFPFTNMNAFFSVHLMHAWDVCLSLCDFCWELECFCLSTKRKYSIWYSCPSFLPDCQFSPDLSPEKKRGFWRKKKCENKDSISCISKWTMIVEWETGLRGCVPWKWQRDLGNLCMMWPCLVLDACLFIVRQSLTWKQTNSKTNFKIPLNSLHYYLISLAPTTN